MRVEVIRSAKRRKSVQARVVDGVVRISIPASMSREDEQKWVSEMVERMERKASASSVDLRARAVALASRHKLLNPVSIRWVDNQEWRWGSCTPTDGSIRISSRLASEPLWVLDYVIVHELAHLSVAGHSKAFWDLVYRYPRTERARGFLIARSWEPADDPGPEPTENPSTAADNMDSEPAESPRVLAGTLF